MDYFRYRTAGLCYRRGMGSEQEQLKGIGMDKEHVVKRPDTFWAYVGLGVFALSFLVSVVNLFGALTSWWRAELWGQPLLGMLVGVVILGAWLVNSMGYNHEA